MKLINQYPILTLDNIARFTRKNIDPEPLGRHGLVENLLEILTVSVQCPYTPSKSHAAAAGGGSASAASRTTPRYNYNYHTKLDAIS